MELKKPTNILQQIEKISSRGCLIEDKDFCISVLSHINYYRFSAYFLPFKESESYKEGTTFNTVYQIYEFDRKMRTLIFSVIEEIELFLRAEFSNFFSHRHGPTGYMDEANFNHRHNHSNFVDNIDKIINKNRDNPAIKHHIDKYEGQFPLWVLIDYFTTGMLSHFYSDLKTTDQKILSSCLFFTSPPLLSSWLRCLTDLRNRCAHYSRLYYWIFYAIPTTPKDSPYKMGRRLFDNIYMLKHLYFDASKWKFQFVIELSALIEQYEEWISLEHIGFPNDWYTLLIE